MRIRDLIRLGGGASLGKSPPPDPTIKTYTQKLRDKYRGYAKDKFNEFGYRLPENHLDVVMMLMVDAYLDGLYHKHP